MIKNWSYFNAFYFAYRCTSTVFAETVIRQYTKLGDSRQYWTSGFDFGSGWYLASNPITENIGAFFSILFFGEQIIISLAFQTIAFYGIYQFLKSLDIESRKYAAILLLFPSFNIWSSVASKEAIIVFAVAIICKYIVDIYAHRHKITLTLLIAIYIIFVYKAHYLPAILFVIGVSLTAQYIFPRHLYVFIVGTFSLLPLYIFQKKISELSFEIIPHFATYGRSTREIYWTEPYDVFYKAPYGMFQSFYGPNLTEAIAAVNVLHIYSYCESAVIIGFLGYLLFRNLPKLPIYSFLLGAFTTFWILFPNYPFGIMNPGSAIRYRTGYIILVFLIFVLFTKPSTYKDWYTGRVKGSQTI